MSVEKVSLFDEVADVDSARLPVSRAGKGTTGGLPRKGRKEAAAKMFRALGPVYSIGPILAHPLSNGKTVAELIVANQDQVFKGFKGFKAGGSFVPVTGLSIGMPNFNTWACAVCGSAHGSGRGPSANSERGLNAEDLQSNDFYFAPKVGKVFVLSATCRAKWFDANGFSIATEPYKSSK